MGTPPGGKKNLTSLILETVEDHGFMVHYLMPKNVAKKARLKRKGVKLHVSNEHIFTAKNIKRYVDPKSARCWKITEKVSFNIASEASYVYIWSGHKLIKNDNLKLAVKQCYQIGQV